MDFDPNPTEDRTGMQVPTSAVERTAGIMASTADRFDASTKFISGDIGAWDYTYTPPAAQGFFGSWLSRRQWKNLNFQSGLTGRHTEAENWNRVLAGLPEAASDRSFQGRVATGAGTVIPYFENLSSGFDVNGYLNIDDQDWDAEKELAALPPFVLETGLKYDPDFETKLKATRNKRGFDLTVNRAMKSQQVLEQIQADDANGWLGGWGSSTFSALTNYVLMDEDTTRTLGFGAVLKGGIGLVNWGNRVSKNAARAAKIGRLRYGAVADDLISKNWSPNAALHNWLTMRTSATQAAAWQGAGIGVAWDLQFQYDAISQADAMYGDTQNMVNYHPSHTLMAAGMGSALGGGIGWAIPALSGKLSSRRSRDISELPDDIAALIEEGKVSFEGLARQHTDDAAMDSINNRLAGLTVTASAETPAVGWMLSREILDMNGRTVDELETFVRYLEAAGEAGVDMNGGVIMSALEEFMVKGLDVRKTSTKAKRKRQAQANAQASQAIRDAGGDIDAAIAAIRSRRTQTRQRVEIAQTLDISPAAIESFNNLAVIRVSHSGKGDSPTGLWPGSHYGSREASTNFAGPGRFSHTGTFTFDRAIMMMDTEGQHDPKALAKEILRQIQSIEGSDAARPDNNLIMRLEDFIQSQPGFQSRGQEDTIANYRKLGDILEEEAGTRTIFYRNSQEDPGSLSMVHLGDDGFGEAGDVISMSGAQFKAWTRGDKMHNQGVPIITEHQWSEFLDSFGPSMKNLWGRITQTIMESHPSFTRDEASSLAAFVFGIRRGMLPEAAEAGVRTAKLTAEELSAFKGVMQTIHDNIAKGYVGGSTNRMQVGRWLDNTNRITEYGFVRSLETDPAEILGRIYNHVEISERALDDVIASGWEPMLRFIDDFVEDVMSPDPAVLSQFEIGLANHLDHILGELHIPGLDKKYWLKMREEAYSTLMMMHGMNKEHVPPDIVFRMMLAEMDLNDRAVLAKYLGHYFDGKSQQLGQDIHTAITKLYEKGQPLTKQILEPAVADVPWTDKITIPRSAKPTNRPPADILTPAEREARAAQVNALYRRSMDKSLSDAERRAARYQALKLSDDSGLTDSAFYAGSPIRDNEIAIATRVSGRNLAELSDSARVLPLQQFVAKWVGDEGQEARQALSRVWREARNKRAEANGFSNPAPVKGEEPPPIGITDNVEATLNEITTLEAEQILLHRKWTLLSDELRELGNDAAGKLRRQEIQDELARFRDDWNATVREHRNARARHQETLDKLGDWIEAVDDKFLRALEVKDHQTWASERAKSLIEKFTRDNEAFMNISQYHRKLGLALEAAQRSSRITRGEAELIRAIWSQSDLKFLENVEIRFTNKADVLTDSGREAAAGMVQRLMRFNKNDKPVFNMTPITRSAGNEISRVITFGHEMLHVALFTTPGLRAKWIKTYSKIINDPRRFGRFIGALRRVMQEEGQAWDSSYVQYFASNADEMFVELGSRYLFDSKFRELMQDALGGGIVQQWWSTVQETVLKMIPYMKNLNWGMSRSEMKTFMSLVDQAAGFKPLARETYLHTGGVNPNIDIQHVAWGVGANRLAPVRHTESPLATMIEKIRAASARGDDKEVSRLNRKMKKLYGKKVVSSESLTDKHVSNMTAAERQQAVNAAFDKLTESQAEVVTGSNAIARAFQFAGLGDLLNRIVTSRQGLGHTMFSDMKELRAVTALFDVGRWGMQKIGVVGPKNLQGAKNWAIRQYEPVARSLEDLRRVAGSRKKFQDAQAEMVKIMARGETTVPASHPLRKQMQQVLDDWTGYMSMMRERGLANGTIRNLADDATFMPLRLDASKVRGNEEKLIQLLTQHWLKKHSVDDPATPLSQQTMRDALGWYTQKLDKNGRPVGKFKVNETVFPDGKLPKTLGDLSEEMKAQYLEALGQKLDHLDGRTALEHAASNYMRRQLGEEGFSGGVREFNKRRDPGRAAASHRTPHSRARRFTQEEVFIENPELGQFFVQDLFELGHNYASATGFRIAAQDVLDDFLGFRGLGWHEFLTTMEQRTLQKLGVDDEAIKHLEGGYEKLHEVFADLAGGLPHMDSGYNTVNAFGANAGRQSALILYGSGIGTTILGVENMWSLFAKIHNPADLFDNLFMLLRTYVPGLRSKAVKEELAGTIMGVQRMQQHAANRLVTGAAEGPGALHWSDRLVTPWKTALDTLTGQITPGGEQSRAGATILRTMEATGQTAQQLGLNRIFNETGWVVQTHALKREMKRYWQRIQTLAADLESRPLVGQTAEARAKEFKQRARVAGFGDRWDIARRFDEAGLLDTTALRALEDAGSDSFALDKMQQYGLGLSGDARKTFFDAHDRLSNLVETEVLKRISEASSLYKTTDVASRTFIGQLMNSMFSFSRAFYSNQVLDAAGMPSRVFLGMLSSYMFFEILTSQLRAVLDGEDPEVIRERWENDPVGELMSNGARVPLLGAWSAIPKYGIDATRKALGNDDVRVFDYSPHQSAGTGAFEKMIKLGTDMATAPVKWASGEQDASEIAADAWEHHSSIIPGVNAFYTETLRTLFEPGYGDD